MIQIECYHKILIFITDFTGGVRFDLDPPPPRDTGSIPSPVIVKSEASQNDQVKVNPDICPKSSPSQSWEIDVRQLISTTKWLQTYGLRKNRLDMKGLLPLIGFRHADGKLYSNFILVTIIRVYVFFPIVIYFIQTITEVMPNVSMIAVNTMNSALSMSYL